MKIALLHRHQPDQIKQTNAAFPYLVDRGIDVLTFKKFNRLSAHWKFAKSLCWIFYAPFLVRGKGYDVIYCDDSYPFYAGLVKMACPDARVILRLGDLHLMYYYSGWKYKLAHWLEKWSWHKVDMIVAISETMAEYIREEIRNGYNGELCHFTPVRVVLDPVEPKDFKCKEPTAKKRKVVMFHGTLTKNKNIDMILEVASMMPELDFIILGSGPEHVRLLKLAPANVYMPGWIPFNEIKYHLNMADVGIAIRGKNPGNEFVVTSPWLQYGVMRIPCVVSERKVFHDIRYHFYFATRNELVNNINYLLENKNDAIKWQDYILKNHSAGKIAYKIWNILTSKK